MTGFYTAGGLVLEWLESCKVQQFVTRNSVTEQGSVTSCDFLIWVCTRVLKIFSIITPAVSQPTRKSL